MVAPRGATISCCQLVVVLLTCNKICGVTLPQQDEEVGYGPRQMVVLSGLTREMELRCQAQVTLFNLDFPPEHPSDLPIFTGQKWVIDISGLGLPSHGVFGIVLADLTYGRYDLQCQTLKYDDDNATYRSFTVKCKYFRGCEGHCVDVEKPIQPNFQVSLKGADNKTLLEQHCDISGDPIALFDETKNSLTKRSNIQVDNNQTQSWTGPKFVLNILYPSPYDEFGAGRGIEIRYEVKRMNVDLTCELKSLAVYLSGYLYVKADYAVSICDKVRKLWIENVPRGMHLVELVAHDSKGNMLADAVVPLALMGASFFEDQNALCLLSYTQSGNHLARFVIEYLTKQPTYGCPGEAHTDPSIYLNEFPGANPLFEVDPFAPPAAYKFHYSTVPTGQGCSWVNEDGHNRCKRLIFLIRDFAECIPRFFEGSGPANALLAHHVDLYLDNIKSFAEFKGSKLLLHYEDLIEDPKAIENLAEYLAVEPERANAFNSNRHELMRLSKLASGRDWMGVRKDNSSYLKSMSNFMICELGTKVRAFLNQEKNSEAERKILKRLDHRADASKIVDIGGRRKCRFVVLRPRQKLGRIHLLGSGPWSRRR